MEPSHEIPSLELLLAQENWVRALARRLVGREGEAEDVAQSALAAALEHPPRSGENAPVLRAWLARVARRLVIGGQRASTRRVDRERRAAREEALPSAGEIHAQEEERRIVVEALLSLGEPFRTTLLLRYYRGLEPIEIARAMDVPDSTVRNRLARGLAQLKQKLEARQGSDWRASCALLAGPLVPASKGVLLGKGVVMGVNLKVAISCSFVALAGLAWWGLHESGAIGPKHETLEVPSAQDLSHEGEKSPADASRSSGMRAKVEQDPSTAVALATPASTDPVGILVYGAVRERDGSPTRGSVLVRVLSSEGRELSRSADDQGAFAFTGLTAGDWRLSASLTGYRVEEQRLHLEVVQPVQRVDIALDGRLRIPVRFRTPEGGGLQDALQKKSADVYFSIRLAVIATERPVGPTIAAKSLTQFERFGLGEYLSPRGGTSHVGTPPAAGEGVDGELLVEDRFPMVVTAVWRNAVLEARRLVSGPHELLFVLSPEQVLGAAGGFRIRLVDAEDHTPMRAGVHLRQHGQTVGTGFAKQTDGVVEFTSLPPGMLQLSLTCPDHEELVEMLEIEAGVVRDLGTRELARTAATEVRVVDEAGHPLGGVGFRVMDARGDSAGRPLRPTYTIGAGSNGLLVVDLGPTERWLVADDKDWTCEPWLLRNSGAQTVVMRRGAELVGVIAESVPPDALLIVRDTHGTCVIIEEAEHGELVRGRLVPGHYDVELVTFDGPLLRKSIDLGDKPLVIDLAP